MKKPNVSDREKQRRIDLLRWFVETRFGGDAKLLCAWLEINIATWHRWNNGDVCVPKTTAILMEAAMEDDHDIHPRLLSRRKYSVLPGRVDS